MEEEANSWLRRTKFSHTICHRLDSSKLVSIPFTAQPERISGLKSRPVVQKPIPSVNSTSVASGFTSQSKRNSMTSKQRSLSPHPETKLSDTFREAKSEKRRYSTPEPRRSVFDKGFKGKRWSSSSSSLSSLASSSSSSSASSNASPLRHLAAMINGDKSRGRRDSSWSKYFDGNSGRVSAVEEADEWTVDMSKLFFGSKFAHGAHSRLYHGMYDGVAVAVKIIKVPETDEMSGVLAARLEKQYVSEVTLLSRLHHQNIIKLVAACRNVPVYCVITEYLPEGSLRAYLHKLECKTLPLDRLIAFALDIARGMEFVHSQGVIHRDLKPENILIDKDFHMKIADFGTACEEAYCDTLADDPGTYRWMAPEMIKHSPYGRKVDVYSFGLILWEMVAGQIPYEDMNPIQAAFAVVHKDLRPAIPRNCPPAMGALIEQCWLLQPEKRPEFGLVVKILEEFESSLARDGSLNLVPSLSCKDQKKGLRHWIHKLGPAPPSSTGSTKPKFL